MSVGAALWTIIGLVGVSGALRGCGLISRYEDWTVFIDCYLLLAVIQALVGRWDLVGADLGIAAIAWWFRRRHDDDDNEPRRRRKRLRASAAAKLRSFRPAFVPAPLKAPSS